MRFDGGRASDGSAPPVLGKHTGEVLRAAGFREDEVAALLESGAAA